MEDIQTKNIQLATLSDRFFAFLVDGMILIIVSIVVSFIAYIINGYSVFNFQNISLNEISSHQQTPFYDEIINYLSGVIIFFLLNGRLLLKYGQTIGKRYMEIIITNKEGELHSKRTIYFLRYLVIFMFPVIPVIGGIMDLIDIVFIFRKDRRCLHDLIVGTKVIAA
jgi:uncharacterized RDD family membrane protein YckC